MTTGTFDPTTDRGKVRLYIGDTDTTNVEFSDGSIDAFLEQNSDSVWLAAADGCRAMAAKKVSSSFIINIAGALNLDKTNITRVWMDLALRYEVRASSSSDMIVEYIDSMSTGLDEFGGDISEYIGED